jgi:hypothetical protein
VGHAIRENHNVRFGSRAIRASGAALLSARRLGCGHLGNSLPCSTPRLSCYRCCTVDRQLHNAICIDGVKRRCILCSARHVAGYVVPRAMLAFSYPTDDGFRLAAHYTATLQVLVYGDENRQ